VKLVEKYEQLDEATKAQIGSLESKLPIEILRNIDNKQAQLERIWILTLVVLSAITFIFLLYELGLPKTISGFFAGSLLLLLSLAIIPAFSGLVSGLFVALPLHLILMLTEDYKYAKVVKEAFESRIREQKRKEFLENLERTEKQQEKMRAIQSDFDEIEKYFASEIALFMPRGRLSHTTDELAKAAISWAMHESKNQSKTESEKDKAIDYYRNLTSLLHFVADDTAVELFKRKEKVRTLLLHTDISATLRNELSAEYSRLNATKELLDMLEASRNLKYLENFNGCVKAF
jgi:hypothetical protein